MSRSLLCVVPLWVVFWSVLSLPATGCSNPAAHCTEGLYAERSLDPNDSPCVQQCDCSNMLYEGYCTRNKEGERRCISTRRENCEVAGRKEICILQDAFHAHLGCKQGERTCKDLNLADLKWGNCRCPASAELPGAEKAQPDSGAGDSGTPEPARPDVAVVDKGPPEQVSKPDPPAPDLPKECEAGEEKACYSGASETKGVGECKEGIRLCGPDNKWSTRCEREVTPTEEKARCDNKDNNCNGIIDDTTACPFTREDRALCPDWCKCETNGGASCVTSGNAHEVGDGVKQNLAVARGFYDKACKVGNDFGCVYLGHMYQRGVGVAKNLATAKGYFEGACNSTKTTDDHGAGCLHLGILYYLGLGVTKDFTKAATYYKKACDEGSTVGCIYLGDRYESGEGVPQSSANARVYYEKACHSNADMGCLYFDAACVTGRGSACGYAGNYYRIGRGVTKDLAKARQLFEKGCLLLKSASSCHQLGLLYKSGEGVTRNCTQAKQYFQQACAIDAKSGACQETCL